MTAQTQQSSQQRTVQLDKTELEMAARLADDKDLTLRQIGMGFLGLMDLSRRYGSILAGEQQFLQSVSTKYDLPPQSRLTFRKDGTLTATIPPMAAMPSVNDPPTAEPSTEETGGESAG